jgi:hypothetical protein
MSVYDYRDRPAYDNADQPRYTNRNIGKWWTPAHDQLLEDLIREWQWDWYWEVSDALASRLPSDALTSYMEVQNWYNNVMYYAITRANDLQITRRIRKPRWKVCRLCNQKFIETSLPHPLVSRLGIDHLDFCAPCLRDTVLQGSGSPTLSREQVIVHIRDLTNAAQRIPPQGFGEGMSDLLGMSFDERLAILHVLQTKPTRARVRQLFASWLEALIAADVLNDDAWRTARGVRSRARDGHVCFSLGEKTIDDHLNSRAVEHSREPRYPKGNFRADFKVGDVLIEYFGLLGDPSYDAKTQEKQTMCKECGVELISIYPADLASTSNLEFKLRRLRPTLAPVGRLLALG